jgi:hypothetical protein
MNAYRDRGTSERLPDFPVSNRSTIDPHKSTFFHKPETNLAVIWHRKAGTALVDVSFQTKHTGVKQCL